MAVSFQHLRGEVSGDGHDFVVAQIGVFEQPTDRLVPEVMPTQVRKLVFLHCGAERVPNCPRRLNGKDSAFADNSYPVRQQ